MPSSKRPQAIDLDAARRERDRNAEPPFVKFGGRRFNLPLEAPWELVDRYMAMIQADEKRNESAAQKAVDAFLVCIFGEEQLAEFLALKPSSSDMRELISRVPKLYALGSQGESKASGVPSKNTSKRSRRTSRTSTPD